MAKIKIRRAGLQGFLFSCGAKRGAGGSEVIAEFHAPWTEENRKAGGWKEVPDTISGSANLVPSSLSATHVELKPRGMVGFSIDCSEAFDFKVFIPTKEGEESELRFKVRTASIHAGKELDRYGRTAGAAPGELNMSHDADAQATIEPAQETLEENEE